MGKIKLNSLQEFEDWKILQLKETIFKNKASQLASMDYPKSYPSVLCYGWAAYATEDAFNGLLNYDYVCLGDFK
jgi:hypothetical protein